MDLHKFERNGRWGLKNDEMDVILDPVFADIFLSPSGGIAVEFVYDEAEGYEQIFIYRLDNSGDILYTLHDKLEKQSIDNLIEIAELDFDLFSFMYGDPNGLEQLGVFTIDGDLIIKPEFDDLEIIDGRIIMAFNAAHYNEHDSNGEKNRGWKLFDFTGRRLCAESVQEGYQHGNDGQLIFTTESGNKLIV